jgi:hypothetical protein
MCRLTRMLFEKVPNHCVSQEINFLIASLKKTLFYDIVRTISEKTLLPFN